MVKLWEVISRAVFLLLTHALPGYCIGDAIATGQFPYWPGIALAVWAWLAALACGTQYKRVSGYKQALVRMQAKQDAGIKYIIHPPESREDETS